MVNARFMAEVQSQQQQQRERIEALQFENERLRCARATTEAPGVCVFFTWKNKQASAL